MTAAPDRAPITNRLLSSLPSSEYDRLSRKLHSVKLPRGRVIYEAGDLADHVYFPSCGVISLLTSTEAGDVIEVAMVGREGHTGTPGITHGHEMPYRAVVQIEAEAMRVEARVVRGEIARGGQLNSLLTCYTHSLLAQVAQSAVCNRFHPAEKRLCRWLLCMHDRVESDTLELTHETTAQMLGTQRAVVTRLAGKLQRADIIEYKRGSVRIRDRRRLEAASCECYRIVNQQLKQCLTSKA